MKLSKFLGILKMKIKEIIAYKIDFLTWMLLMPMHFAIQYFLWKSIFSNSTTEVIRGFTFNDMVIYYLLTMIISTLIFTFIDKFTADRIRYGNFIRYITKPISYFKFTFIRHIAAKLFSLLVQISPIIILAIILLDINATQINFILFIISAMLASTLSFIFVFTFGLAAFWLKRYDGMRFLRQGFVWLFSGAGIPLVFFPESLQTIFNYLPFQYLMYIPISIFLGRYDLISALTQISIQIFWIVALYMIMRLIWEKAITKFMGVGT